MAEFKDVIRGIDMCFALVSNAKLDNWKLATGTDKEVLLSDGLRNRLSDKSKKPFAFSGYQFREERIGHAMVHQFKKRGTKKWKQYFYITQKAAKPQNPKALGM